MHRRKQLLKQKQKPQIQLQPQHKTTSTESKAVSAGKETDFDAEKAFASRSIPQDLVNAYNAISLNPGPFVNRVLIGAALSVLPTLYGFKVKIYDYPETYKDRLIYSNVTLPRYAGDINFGGCDFDVTHALNMPGVNCGFLNPLNTFLPAYAEAQAFDHHRMALLMRYTAVPALIIANYWGAQTVMHRQNQAQEIPEVADSFASFKDAVTVLPRALFRHRSRIYYRTWVGMVNYGTWPTIFAVGGSGYTSLYRDRLSELAEIHSDKGCKFSEDFGYEVKCDAQSTADHIHTLATLVALAGYKIGYELGVMMQYSFVLTGAVGFVHGVKEAVVTEVAELGNERRVRREDLALLQKKLNEKEAAQADKATEAPRVDTQRIGVAGKTTLAARIAQARAARKLAQAKEPIPGSGRWEKSWNYVASLYRSLCGARPKPAASELDFDLMQLADPAQRASTKKQKSTAGSKRKSQHSKVNKPNMTQAPSQNKETRAAMAPVSKPVAKEPSIIAPDTLTISSTSLAVKLPPIEGYSRHGFFENRKARSQSVDLGVLMPFQVKPVVASTQPALAEPLAPVPSKTAAPPIPRCG